jgi:phytoene dehydrogenase-like protein
VLVKLILGAEIFLNCHVDRVLVEDIKGAGGKTSRAVGVQLSDGRKLMAKQVI